MKKMQMSFMKYLLITGKVTNIEYGKIDFENKRIVPFLVVNLMADKP